MPFSNPEEKTYLPIGELSMTDSFRTLREKVNAWARRIDMIKFAAGETVLEADDDNLMRAGEIKKFVIMMNLVLE
jgi:hypothetical protein